jgi:hypothetical protein
MKEFLEFFKKRINEVKEGEVYWGKLGLKTVFTRL